MRKASKYKPKEARVNQLAICLSDAKPLPPADQDELATAYLLSIDAIARGAGEVSDLVRMTDMGNTVSALVHGTPNCRTLYQVDGYDSGPMKDAIRSMAHRYRETGRVGVAGAELQALRDTAEALQTLLVVVTRGQLKVLLRDLKAQAAREDTESIDLGEAVPA